ncbi:hypothetical protein AMJ44_08390 [candidate division WOR-1 bacterium DG_54_3]|uniref:Uncharacterized protein n=1 Tax=candidate division WOR-1 bacterium DG_54_3 TaxID=1703775 RepID=A0A0S7XVE2_UNCSA|nr:MAG: hypothetical protein AMJ44_08390 [candidate division WOR-1 bacterium DG_54_3]
MVEKTLEKIKAIEEKAEGITKLAYQSSVVTLKKSHERHEKELHELAEKLKKEEENLIRTAGEEAKQEAKAIEANSKKEMDELKKKTIPKSSLAKKEILRWRS